MSSINITSDGMSTTHLAWILNISREWQREPMKSAVVQERMNAKFPASEHVAIWQRLLVSIGVK
jgi:hypothetical protein